MLSLPCLPLQPGSNHRPRPLWAKGRATDASIPPWTAGHRSVQERRGIIGFRAHRDRPSLGGGRPGEKNEAVGHGRCIPGGTMSKAKIRHNCGENRLPPALPGKEGGRNGDSEPRDTFGEEDRGACPNRQPPTRWPCWLRRFKRRWMLEWWTRVRSSRQQMSKSPGGTCLPCDASGTSSHGVCRITKKERGLPDSSRTLLTGGPGSPHIADVPASEPPWECKRKDLSWIESSWL